MAKVPLPDHHLRRLHPPCGDDFTVLVRIEGGMGVVFVRGELDLATAGLLADTLDAYRPVVTGFVFDLVGVTFVDLAGLEPIRHHADGRAVIRTTSRMVDRLLDVARLEELRQGG